MFLTREAILAGIEDGSIDICPFEPAHLSPNSVDVTLHRKLLIYDLAEGENLDLKKDHAVRKIEIPANGIVLQPGILYLGMTNETATSHRYIPMFEGRSSIGRLGINTHITAGFGDVGWGYRMSAAGELECLFPTWTLEITVIHPVRVYADVRIGQVYFVEPKGKVELYAGKYSVQKEPQASKSWQDFIQ